MVLALLAPAGAALAKDPPEKSEQYSAVSQYREMLPGAGGSSVLGGDDKPQQVRPLPEQTTERVYADGGEDARVLEEIATSSNYAAPQKALPAVPKAKRAVPKSSAPHDEGGREADLPPVRRGADTAVFAAAGGIFSDTGGGRFGFLAFVLMAITAACVAGAVFRRRDARRD